MADELPLEPLSGFRQILKISKSAHIFSILFTERKNMSYLKRLIREESGQDMIEYGLLAAFVSIVAIATLQAIGPPVSSVYVSIQNALPAVP